MERRGEERRGEERRGEERRGEERRGEERRPPTSARQRSVGGSNSIDERGWKRSPIQA
jgi:hypothetical protein